MRKIKSRWIKQTGNNNSYEESVTLKDISKSL